MTPKIPTPIPAEATPIAVPKRCGDQPWTRTTGRNPSRQADPDRGDPSEGQVQVATPGWSPPVRARPAPITTPADQEEAPWSESARQSIRPRGRARRGPGRRMKRRRRRGSDSSRIRGPGPPGRPSRSTRPRSYARVTKVAATMIQARASRSLFRRYGLPADPGGVTRISPPVSSGGGAARPST